MSPGRQYKTSFMAGRRERWVGTPHKGPVKPLSAGGDLFLSEEKIRRELMGDVVDGEMVLPGRDEALGALDT